MRRPYCWRTSPRSASGQLFAAFARWKSLTERELEVLCPVATSMNNREIGAVLFVADSTVKTHVEHIIGKLSVSDRAQAAVWAARQGSSETGGPLLNRLDSFLVVGTLHPTESFLLTLCERTP